MFEPRFRLAQFSLQARRDAEVVVRVDQVGTNGGDLGEVSRGCIQAALCEKHHSNLEKKTGDGLAMAEALGNDLEKLQALYVVGIVRETLTNVFSCLQLWPDSAAPRRRTAGRSLTGFPFGAGAASTLPARPGCHVTLISGTNHFALGNTAPVTASK